MKERPILFSGPMVRAILAGAKTQTRRPLKTQPRDIEGMPIIEWPIAATDAQAARFCPYGQPGDRLWVREMWRPVMESWRSFVEYAAGGDVKAVHTDAMIGQKKLALRFAGARKDRHSEAWRPSIHMPRWASRLTLEATDVGVERLHAITEADAKAEGFEDRAAFLATWADIYGEGDQWVWVVSFKRVEG